MSSPTATSSSHYHILDSKEAHNHFDHTNCTAKLRDYILKPHPNHINLTLNQNITPPTWISSKQPSDAPVLESPWSRP